MTHTLGLHLLSSSAVFELTLIHSLKNTIQGITCTRPTPMCTLRRLHVYECNDLYLKNKIHISKNKRKFCFNTCSYTLSLTVPAIAS